VRDTRHLLSPAHQTLTAPDRTVVAEPAPIPCEAEHLLVAHPVLRHASRDVCVVVLHAEQRDARLRRELLGDARGRIVGVTVARVETRRRVEERAEILQHRVKQVSRRHREEVAEVLARHDGARVAEGQRALHLGAEREDARVLRDPRDRTRRMAARPPQHGDPPT